MLVLSFYGLDLAYRLVSTHFLRKLSAQHARSWVEMEARTSLDVTLYVGKASSSNETLCGIASVLFLLD